MPNLNEINDLLIAEQAKQIAGLDSLNKILKAKLANSVHTVKISTIISKNNFAMSKDSRIILEDLRLLLSNQPINQESES